MELIIMSGTHQTNLPLEYKIFGLDGLPLNYFPAPFTPIDVIHMILTMGLLLTYNPTDDVNNWQLISNMGWQNFSELMDLKNNNMQFNFSQMQMITPPQVPASWNAVSALSSQNSVPKVTFPLGEFQSPIYREVLQTLGNGLTGSNNWAVAPNRTQNGAADALCNDPHLDIGTPGIMKGWHLICTDPNFDINAIGTQVPLAPMLALGRTDNIAWGVTTTGYDTTDSWVQTLNSDYTSYLYNGTWQPTIIENYTFTPLGSNPVNESVVEIPDHGIMMNISNYLVSVRWGDFNDTSHIVSALFRMINAKSITEFKQYLNPLTGWDDILQNMVIADSSGHIGFIAAGKIPNRLNNNSYGMIPQNGSDPADDWNGWLSFDQLPQSWDPSTGFVCTANSRTAAITDSYPYYLTYHFWNDNRQDRITQLLSNSSQQNIDTLNAIQCDTLDWYANQVVPVILNATKDITGSTNIAARNALSSWDDYYDIPEVGGKHVLLYPSLGGDPRGFYPPNLPLFVRVYFPVAI